MPFHGEHHAEPADRGVSCFQTKLVLVVDSTQKSLGDGEMTRKEQGQPVICWIFHSFIRDSLGITCYNLSKLRWHQ